MRKLSANGLSACLRGNGMKINGTVTPRKYEIKPTILSTDGQTPPVLEGIRYSSDRPRDWYEWSGLGCVCNGNGIALSPGQVEGYAVVTLYLGHKPVIDWVRFESTGTATVAFRTAATAAALASEGYTSDYSSGDNVNFQCDKWLGIRVDLADAESAASVTELNIYYSNQNYIPKVTSWGHLSSQLTDNGCAHTIFSPVLHNWALELAQSSILARELAVVASFGTRNAKDYISLWEGSVSKVAESGITGGLATDYLTQYIPRYKMADGTYWPTPFGDFSDSEYVLIDEPHVANYDLGARITVLDVDTGESGFKTCRITLTWDGSEFQADADEFETTSHGTTSVQIDDGDGDTITTISLSYNDLQTGDFVNIYLYKGGRCPAPYHGSDESESRIHILGQWPISSVSSVWAGDLEIPAARYTAHTSGDYAGRENIAYMEVDKLAQAAESVAYSGQENYWYPAGGSFGISNAEIAGDPTTGELTTDATSDYYVHLKTNATGGFKSWTGTSEPASYTSVTAGQSYDIGYGLSISFSTAPTAIETDTLHLFKKNDFTWSTSTDYTDRLVSSYKTGTLKLEIDSVNQSNGNASVKGYIDDTADTSWDFTIENSNAVTKNGLQFSFQRGTAYTQRQPGESWSIELSALDMSDLRYCGVGIDGSTTLPDIVTSIVNWSPGDEYFLSRNIIGSVAELPPYAITGQLPPRTMTVEHVLRELCQNIADLDASRGYIRFVLQDQDVDYASFHIGPEDMADRVRYLGTALDGIQNDISLEYGDGFHLQDTVSIRKLDQKSINRWERLNGYDQTWGSSVRYPYTYTRDDADTICQSRLDYKKNPVRYYKITLNKPLHMLTDIGDKHLKFTDLWIPNDTHMTYGVGSQPCRVVGVNVDLDSQETVLTVTVVGPLEQPSPEYSIGPGEELFFAWGIDGQGWGEAPWKYTSRQRRIQL